MKKIHASLFVIFLTLPLFFCNRDANNTQTDKSAQLSKELPLPDTITVAFYNVENLFDFVLDGTEYDEYKPGAFGWTEEVQKRKLKNIASVIAALQSDVVGLSEVENMNVLRELQLELDKMDMVFPYAAVANTPGSAVLNAILSKFPIREKFEHPVEKSRSILEVLIGRGDDSLRVFVNHWPSKRHPESKRLEAAITLRKRIDELSPTDNYIILGDFNSNYNEFATFHTEGFNDTKGQTGINHILKTTNAGTAPRSSKTFICIDELATCGDCHYNLWLDLPEDRRKSYVFRGAPQTIDHILIPPALIDTPGFSYLKGSFEVFTWDDKLLRDGVPYRWQMIYKGKVKYHAGHGFSDHLPIRARFIRASVASADTSSFYQHYCETIDPNTARKGDFAVSVDGWIRGDSRFSVSRDSRFAKSGTHSLHIRGMHESENRTAAKARFETEITDKHLTMSMRGSGSISLRIRRPAERWVYYNAPDFTQSKSARYNKWSANRWTDIKIPLPAGTQNTQDVEVEIRAGKGEAVSMWIDQVRLR
jgi:endonuclease/exonuclease/phosphatase family metal-dependent hydrolase